MYPKFPNQQSITPYCSRLFRVWLIVGAMLVIGNFYALARTPQFVLVDPQDSFPVPNNIAHQLFYLQRTTNTNTIVYCLNTNAKGAIDESNPIKVFWIRYPEGGMRKDLNYIQKTFAYGTHSARNSDGSFSVRLVAYKKQELFLRKLPNEMVYRIFTFINKKYSILNRVFIKIDPGGSLFKPNIAYIELKGIELASGKPILERFKP